MGGVLIPDCYAVEQVTKWENANEADGSVEQTPAPTHLIRAGVVITLEQPLGVRGELFRMTFDGGYVPERRARPRANFTAFVDGGCGYRTTRTVVPAPVQDWRLARK